MAFIRKRGNAYYLVHNIRRKGRVEQLHLACLGRRPRIDERIIQGVTAKHPFVRVDWDGLRERASQELASPVANDSEYLRKLIGEIRDFHMSIAEIQLPLLQLMKDRELRSQLVTELKLLRGTLDVKISSSRRQDLLNLRGKYS